jgi:hypothetical protein
MFKFGDRVKFSEEWFKANHGQGERWNKKARETKMIVGGVKGDSATVVKEGTRYSVSYHISFLELADDTNSIVRQETAKEIFTEYEKLCFPEGGDGWEINDDDYQALKSRFLNPVQEINDEL